MCYPPDDDPRYGDPMHTVRTSPWLVAIVVAVVVLGLTAWRLWG